MSVTNVVTMPKRTRPRKSNKVTRGEGHLFRRGETFWFELSWKGSRTRKSLGTTDRETALIKMGNAVAAIRSGEKPKTFDPVSIQSLYDIWIAEIERTCKQRTLEDYKSRWNGHLKSVFGHMFATQVTKDIVSKYLTGRKREGAGNITQNRENRVLQMIFNYNKKKMPANDFPEFPAMHSEKAHVRKGRLSLEDYNTLIKRLEDPQMFWLKVIITMTFKYGFRKGELLNAKCGYFNAKTSTFVLPAFTTKNKMEREVSIKRDGDIYHMLTKLTDGCAPEEALFRRNGKGVRDYRGTWNILTAGINNGRGGHITLHDLRRSAITNMSNKKIGAAEAGTHLTADVFNRYISRSEEEKQATSAVVEG